MSEPPHPPRVGRRKRRRAPPSPHFWDLRLPESEGPHRSPRVGPMLRFESDLRSDSPKGEGPCSCTVAHGTSRHSMVDELCGRRDMDVIMRGLKSQGSSPALPSPGEKPA